MSATLSVYLNRYRNTLTVLTLVFMVLVSAVSVVYSSYQARQHFNAVQQSYRETVQLEEEWGRLLLEQSTWASHDRIENTATTSLGMVSPVADDIVVVRQ